MSHPNKTAPAEIVAAAVEDGKKHLLLAASGSVATIKLVHIIKALAKHPNLSIRVILTSSAANFLNGTSQEQPTIESLASLPNVDGVYQDQDELRESWTRGAGILHINLRKWAHILVIAPLSANTMAKIVNGMSDNLLTDTVRAWDTTGLEGMEKRIVAFPAMNVAMWVHPVTAQQLRVLQQAWGVKLNQEGKKTGDGWFEVFEPIDKRLACGDLGIGGMREWTEIVSIIEARLDLATHGSS
ncbi:Uncharacterized protein PECH_001201 [Penicillium ucsense]|uniref:Flavoprotein domain-containing protein n=1 Tax=Penicillium ucsense TaxID=2839758 RepID=A0A8J8WMG2_9EURO|nr:Uncharacterized protein PECM_000002 [Penicillium ucsense]KAF7733052.1 Uncharacterized protein PECH_001201 [Penicillium ucsense]